jgi:hypothetical protein
MPGILIRSSSKPPAASPERVDAVARYVIAHPWEVFVARWNWKAAALSALFRGLAFALPVASITGEGALRSVAIEIAFRVALGGFWGSLLQAFRGAQPAWLAGLCVAVVLPAGAHLLEYAALRAGHAHHIITAMIVSIIVSIGSLLINFGLMRRGLLITGEDGAPLRRDLQCIPAALAGMFRSLLRLA